MNALSELMSGDAVWAVLAAVILPAIGGLWWYIVMKTSHLYSKVAEVKEDLAAKTEQLERLRHDFKNQKLVVDWNAQKLAERETDINYLFWELNKDYHNEQSLKAERPSNRQPLRRPEQP